MTTPNQRSYIKIETLRGKNPTEILGVLSEVCGELIVDIVRFLDGLIVFRRCCVSINNDPRPGRQKISTDERRVQLVADSLVVATCEELSRATGAKTSHENAK